MGVLAGFTETEFTHGGVTRPVHVGGAGPAVVVIHEIPGITPKVADFGRKVVDTGFRAYLPSLVGTPGREPGAGYVVSSLWKVCVSKEFTTWATGRTSPVISWLRALAAQAHTECGGPGVGAVGMCFSGGFALGMMLDDRMLAPVLSQPSLPFALGRKRAGSVGLSDSDLAAVKRRVASDETACVLGLRFTSDKTVPPARFAAYRELLGERFVGVEIPSPDAARGIGKSAHSVLTEHLVDEPGHPTVEALNEVLDFFRTRLSPGL